MSIRAIFDRLAIMKEIAERGNFPPAVAVSLQNWSDLDEASTWAEARWKEAQRKYRRKVDAVGYQAHFEFEHDDDQIEFLLRYG
jgi:hypothetical protein